MKDFSNLRLYDSSERSRRGRVRHWITQGFNRFWRHRVWAAWLALLVWALWVSGWGRVPLINWAGFPLVAEFLTAAVSPALDRAFLMVMAQATLVTFAFAVCGTALSLVVGLIFGVLCSGVWWQACSPGSAGRTVWWLLQGALAIPRAIHELIWGLLLLGVIGLDPLVGVLAIAVPFGAITAKVFAEILDETPTDALQVLLNSGVRPGRAFLYGHLSQALPNLISYSFYRFECSLRAAAVLGVIGAGGLGYQIFLSLQSLQYAQLWTGFYALMLLCGAVDAWSAGLRQRMGFVSRLELTRRSKKARLVGREDEARSPDTNDSLRREGTSSASQKASIYVRLSYMAIAAAIPLCFAYLNLDWSRLARMRSHFADTFGQMTPAQVLPEFSLSLLPLALQTVAMSVLAITLAGLVGVALSFPAARTFFLPGGVLRSAGEGTSGLLGRWQTEHLAFWLARAGLLMARAIPAPILALVILYGMLPGIWPGALALAIHNFGILGRLMAEVNENLPEGPLRSLRSLGASSSGVIFYGILPSNLARFLAYILYRWEVCLRETVIVGLVGAGGLGRLMTEQLSSFDYSGLAATLCVFILLTVVVDALSGWMRAAVR